MTNPILKVILGPLSHIFSERPIDREWGVYLLIVEILVFGAFLVFKHRIRYAVLALFLLIWIFSGVLSLGPA